MLEKDSNGASFFTGNDAKKGGESESKDSKKSKGNKGD
jgi:hypothetical protein